MAEANYLVHKRLLDGSRIFDAGTVANLDTAVGDALVADGWAEKQEPARTRKAKAEAAPDTVED